MSAIIEPESAQWWVRASSGSPIRISATSEEHSVVILRRYAGGGTEEIEIKLSELPDVEAALLNAQLWLERATRQLSELRAAEEVAEDAASTEIDDSDPGMGAATQIMFSLARLRGRS